MFADDKAKLDERKRIIELLGSDEAFDIIYSYGDGGADEVAAGLINLIKGS